MKTGIRFANLKGKPRAEQVKLLAGAIKHEFAKPIDIAEALGVHAFAASPHVKLLSPVGAPGNVHERIKAHLARKYATPSDTPALNDVANEFEQWFHSNMPELDLSFAMLFDLVDLRGSTHDHFDILDTNAGISWQQRRPGEATQIRRAISETKTTVPYLEFSDGLGILDAWLDFQQFWNIDEAIAEFRAKYFDRMAALHYGLFTALGAGIDVAFDTDDATTFNKAAAAIVRSVYSSGYGVSQNVQFDILCAIEHVGRIERMLTAQRGSAMVDFGTMKQPLAFRVRSIIGTVHVPANDTGYYLILPGRKLKRGVWKDLTVESARNIYVTATDLVGVGRYNAAIGDTNQVRRVKFA